jgi:hypothetical protein
MSNHGPERRRPSSDEDSGTNGHHGQPETVLGDHVITVIDDSPPDMSGRPLPEHMLRQLRATRRPEPPAAG